MNAQRALLTVAIVGLTAIGACKGDEVIDPPFRDTVKPRISVAKGTVGADTMLAMSVSATDNVGLKVFAFSSLVASRRSTTRRSRPRCKQ